MNLETGRSYLITVKDWIHVPDGRVVCAVLGHVESTHKGYIKIGSVLLEHEQVYAAVETNDANLAPAWRDVQTAEGFEPRQHTLSRVYDARRASHLKAVEVVTR